MALHVNHTHRVKHKMPELLEGMNRLGVMIKSTTSDGINQAATELRFLLANLLNECHDIADQTLDKADGRLKNNIDYALAGVDAIEQRATNKGIEMMSRLTYAAQAMTSNAPLLLSIEPSCIIRTAAVGNKTFKLLGYFPNVGHPNYRPSLVLNGQRATLTKPLQTECSFTIPHQVLFSSKLDWCTAQVEIPYQGNAGHLYMRYVYKYKLLIGILPDKPGIIIVEHTKNITKRSINPRSEHFHLQSGHSTKNNENRLCGIKASEGWKVLRGSQQVQMHHNKGDTYFQLHIENEEQVAYRAMTHYSKSKNRCGEIRFTLSLTEYQDKEEAEPPIKTPVDLQWNESKVLNYPPKTWKVIFTPAGSSSPREFLMPTHDDPLIDITYEGDRGLRITAKDPNKIKQLEVTADLPEGFTNEESKEPWITGTALLTHGVAFGTGLGIGAYAHRWIAKL